MCCLSSGVSTWSAAGGDKRVHAFRSIDTPCPLGTSLFKDVSKVSLNSWSENPHCAKSSLSFCFKTNLDRTLPLEAQAHSGVRWVAEGGIIYR